MWSDPWRRMLQMFFVAQSWIKRILTFCFCRALHKYFFICSSYNTTLYIMSKLYAQRCSKNKKNTFLKYLLIKPDSVFVFCSVVHKQNFPKLSDCIMFVTFIYMHEIHLDEEEEDTSSICNLIVQKTSLNSIR